MEFIDLKKQQLFIRNKIDESIKKVLDHGRYINGPEVSELENKLAEYVGVKYALGVASGTDALLMSLMAYEVGVGDAIFTTSYSFFATAEVISLLGATPVFVDICDDTYNIDVKKLLTEINRVIEENKLRPRGIIGVDLFGQAADYDEINLIAKEKDLFVIEDAAQSFGGLYKGKKNCSLADVAATSFFPAKPLGCYGDGGMIFTNNEDIYKKLVSIRIHGKGNGKYDNIRIGINGRLDTIQAAILLVKFEIFDNELKIKNNIAEQYNQNLSSYVKVPTIRDGNLSAWAQYSVESDRRNEIIEHLKKNNIPAMIYYPKPMPFQMAYNNMNFKKGDFPISENVSDRIFSLPMHAYIGDDQVKVISAIKEVIG